MNRLILGICLALASSSFSVVAAAEEDFGISYPEGYRPDSLKEIEGEAIHEERKSSGGSRCTISVTDQAHKKPNAEIHFHVSSALGTIWKNPTPLPFEAGISVDTENLEAALKKAGQDFQRSLQKTCKTEISRFQNAITALEKKRRIFAEEENLANLKNGIVEKKEACFDLLTRTILETEEVRNKKVRTNLPIWRIHSRQIHDSMKVANQVESFDPYITTRNTIHLPGVPEGIFIGEAPDNRNEGFLERNDAGIGEVVQRLLKLDPLVLGKSISKLQVSVDTTSKSFFGTKKHPESFFEIPLDAGFASGGVKLRGGFSRNMFLDSDEMKIEMGFACRDKE